MMLDYTEDHTAIAFFVKRTTLALLAATLEG